MKCLQFLFIQRFVEVDDDWRIIGEPAEWLEGAVSCNGNCSNGTGLCASSCFFDAGSFDGSKARITKLTDGFLFIGTDKGGSISCNRNPLRGNTAIFFNQVLI